MHLYCDTWENPSESRKSIDGTYLLVFDINIIYNFLYMFLGSHNLSHLITSSRGYIPLSGWVHMWSIISRMSALSIRRRPIGGFNLLTCFFLLWYGYCTISYQFPRGVLHILPSFFWQSFDIKNSVGEIHGSHGEFLVFDINVNKMLKTMTSQKTELVIITDRLNYLFISYLSPQTSHLHIHTIHPPGDLCTPHEVHTSSRRLSCPQFLRGAPREVYRKSPTSRAFYLSHPVELRECSLCAQNLLPCVAES